MYIFTEGKWSRFKLFYFIRYFPTITSINPVQKVKWDLPNTDSIRTPKTMLYVDVSLVHRLSSTVLYHCLMRKSSPISGILYSADL